MTKKLTNGFATKKDILRLEKKMDRRFEQVDKRFEQVDKRFEQVDKRFEQVSGQFRFFREDIKEDLDFFKSDTFLELRSEWDKKIDPILAEIKYHREKENLVYEQYNRLSGKIDTLTTQLGTLTGQVGILTGHVGKIAKKVGVKL